MKRTWAAALVAVLATPVRAQDALDRQIENIVEKMSRTGPAGKLVELSGSEAGRAALREMVLSAASWKTSRFDRDPQSNYELHLFERDELGVLTLKPKCAGDVELVKRRIGRSRQMLDEFGRRLEEFARQISDGSELDRRMKGVWKDEEVRASLLYRFAREVQALDPEELFDYALAKAFRRGADGKLRVSPNSEGEVSGVIDEILEPLQGGLEDHESKYAAWVEKVSEEDARRRASAAPARTFAAAKMWRLAEDGAEDPLGRLLEEYGRDAGLLKAIDERQKIAEDLEPLFSRIAAEFASGGSEANDKVRRLLTEPRAGILLADHLVSLKKERLEKAGAFFDGLREDWFESRGSGLSVKAGRFKGEDGQDSADVLENEVKGSSSEYNDWRSAFEDMADRCRDPGLAQLLETKTATYILVGHCDWVMEGLKEEAQAGSMDMFVKRYLVLKGDRYHLREDRAKKVDEAVRRAAQIAKEEAERQ